MKSKYVLYLCDTSWKHEPIAKFTSETPFHSVQVGDRFDDIGWNRLNGVGPIATPSKPIRYTVHSIKHLMEDSGEELVIQYYLNLEPFHGQASPVWPE